MSAGKRRELAELEEALEQVQRAEPAQPLEVKRIEEEIAALKNKIATVPFIDTFDLRYKKLRKATSAKQSRGNVLLNGCVWLDGSSHQGHCQAFLYLTVSVSFADV